MKKLLLINAIFLLVQCSATKEISVKERQELQKEIAKMIENDQKYRRFIQWGTLDQEKIDSIESLSKAELVQYMINNLNNSELTAAEEDSLRNLQAEIDTLNTEKLINIIEKYGWPSPERIGGNKKADIILLHIPFSKFNSMSKLLKKEVKKGRFEAKLFATFYDNILLKQGKPQFYGTNQIISPSGEALPPTIEDIEKTNKARKEIGLAPLTEYK